MTVVNPKSISGITSITTASGSDDLLSIHTNNGTERLRIGSSGQIGIAGANYGSSGQVLTSAGSGSAVSWSTITGTTINANTDHYIITGTGTANTLQGESNLTYNGDTLQVVEQGGDSANGSRLDLKFGNNNTTDVISSITFSNGAGEAARIQAETSGANNSGLISFYTDNAGTSGERLRIDSAGRLLQGLTTARGNFGNNTSGVEVSRQLEGTSYITACTSIIRNSNDANDGGIILGKSRATSVGGNTVVQAGDFLGEIMWAGADGTSLQEAARIDAVVESGVGNDDMPAALRFLTNSGTTSPTERLRITSSGALLVGLTSPTYNSGDMQHEIKKDNSRTYTAPLMSAHSHLLLNNSDTTTNAFCGLGIRAGSADGAIGYVYTGSANSADFVINTDGGSNGVERFRITNDGKILIGTTTGTSDPWGYGAHFQLNGDSSGGESTLSLARHSADTGAPVIVFGKSRATGQADVTVVQDGDTLGSIHFTGADGSNWEPAASIMAYVDGTPASSGDGTDMPGRLCFYTTADGTDTASERLRITSTGDVKWSAGSRSSNVNSICASNGNSIDINGTEYLYFRTNNSERFRVKPDGTLLHGITSTSHGTTSGIILSSYTDGANDVTPGTLICSTTDIALIANLSDSNDGVVAVWRKGGSSKGNVSISGDTTTYNTSSDYRLKENNVAISDGITRVKLLKPYRFNWKSNPSKTVDGFFAHEVTPVVPEAVQGEKDATPGECGMGYQSMDHAKLVPLLTAALQEEISKREALETRIAALESA